MWRAKEIATAVFFLAGWCYVNGGYWSVLSLVATGILFWLLD